MVEVIVSCRRRKRAMLLAVAFAEQENRGLDMLMRAVSAAHSPLNRERERERERDWNMDGRKKAQNIFTPDPCHPTPPHIRQPCQDAGQARKRACCVVGAPQLSDSANKLIRCWHRGGRAWRLLCLEVPKLSCGIVFPAALQQCHGVARVSAAPIRGSLLSPPAATARRRMASTATRWENSGDGGIRRRRQAGRQISCRRRFAHGGRHGSCLHCVAAAPPRREVTPASRLPGGAHVLP